MPGRVVCQWISCVLVQPVCVCACAPAPASFVCSRRPFCHRGRLCPAIHGASPLGCTVAHSTGKYSFVTFLPKFLFEQFSQYANMFFLMTSIVQVPYAPPPPSAPPPPNLPASPHYVVLARVAVSLHLCVLAAAVLAPCRGRLGLPAGRPCAFVATAHPLTGLVPRTPPLCANVCSKSPGCLLLEDGLRLCRCPSSSA